jgi:hypothetical protein
MCASRLQVRRCKRHPVSPLLIIACYVQADLKTTATYLNEHVSRCRYRQALVGMLPSAVGTLSGGNSTAHLALCPRQALVAVTSQ